MPNIMFKVGNTDYSSHVIGKEYQVQNNPQFVSWQDANGHEHRSVYRHKVSGSFNLLFETIEDYQAFCTDLAANEENDTSYFCTVFDNLSNTEITSYFFLSFTPARHIGGSWEDRTGLIKMTITER